MEDDWILLGDGTGSGSDSDSASASDDDSGFTIVRRGRKGGDRCSAVVSDDAPALPRVAAAVAAVPQPTPPGLSVKVVSYAEAFSASASASCSSDEDGGIASVAQNGIQDIFDMLFPKATDSSGSDIEDDDCLESGEEDDIANVAQNGIQDIFDMLFPKATDSSGSDVEDDDCLESDEKDDIANVAQNGIQDIFDMLFPTDKACGANMDDYEEEEDGSLFDMLLRDCAIDDDIDSSDGEDEAATAAAACGYSAEPSQGTRLPEFAVRAARGYDDVDVDTDSDMDDGDGEVAADVNGTDLYGWPRARASHCRGFACQSQTERQALWEDLQLQLAAEAFESSGQQQQKRSDDDVDDTCDVPGTAAPGGGPAGSCTCAPTPEAQFTARSVRDTERELAMEEARRREAALRELDRALAREAALEDCATAERQATVDVTRPAVAKRDVPADLIFIIGVYVLVFLVISLLSLALPSN